MSEEQLKAFLEAVKADEGLQEKLKAAGDADAVVAIAKAAGFAISAEELQRAQAELSDEELEGVAGYFFNHSQPASNDFPYLAPFQLRRPLLDGLSRGSLGNQRYSYLPI
jgi:predicted ribosomally synthesized peptide with nif11-like leader